MSGSKVKNQEKKKSKFNLPLVHENWMKSHHEQMNKSIES